MKLLPSGSAQVGGAPVEYLTAVIASGGSTSGAVDLGGRMLAGIDLPTLTGTSLSLTASVDGSTYRTVKDTTGATIAWTVASNTSLKFNPPIAGLGSIKLVSGSTEGGTRTLTLICIP